jgi:hypothetical protein
VEDTSQPPWQLTFYCDACDLQFKAEPDGTGYEQAPCPKCRYVCVTVDFLERERQERRRAQIPGLSWLVAQLGMLVGKIEGPPLVEDDAVPSSPNPYEAPRHALGPVPVTQDTDERELRQFAASVRPLWLLAAASLVSAAGLLIGLMSSARMHWEFEVLPSAYTSVELAWLLLQGAFLAYVAIVLWRYMRELRAVKCGGAVSPIQLATLHNHAWQTLAWYAGLYLSVTIALRVWNALHF